MQLHSVTYRVSFWQVQKCSFQSPSLVFMSTTFAKITPLEMSVGRVYTKIQRPVTKMRKSRKRFLEFFQKNKIFQKMHYAPDV